jgi:hypothetical protein
MHIKSNPAMFINGKMIALMIAARSLALLLLPIGCLASRQVAVRQPVRHTRS